METPMNSNADLLDQMINDVPWHLTGLDDFDILESSARSAPTVDRCRAGNAKRSPSSHRVKKQNRRPSLQRAQSYSLGSKKQRSRNHLDCRSSVDKKEASLRRRQKKSRMLSRSKSTSKLETVPFSPRLRGKPRKDNSRTRRSKKKERSDEITCYKAGFPRRGSLGTSKNQSTKHFESKISDSTTSPLHSPVSRRNMFAKSKSLRILSTTGTKQERSDRNTCNKVDIPTRGSLGANERQPSNNSESKIPDAKTSPMLSPVSRRNMFAKSKSLRILSTSAGAFLHGGRGKTHRGRRLSP